MQWVKVDSCNRSCMPAVRVTVNQPRLGPSSVISICLIHGSLFSTDEERPGLVVWEIHTGHRDLVRLSMPLVTQLEGFLMVGVVRSVVKSVAMM